MRHLILTFIFAVSNLALTKASAQTAPPPSPQAAVVAAAMSRGSIVCSTWKQNLKVSGGVLDDNSARISFSYIGGATFTHKFMGKAMTNGKFTVYGHLVELSNLPNAKSWFEMSEEMFGKEIYHTFKFSPVYRTDGSIVKEKAKDGSMVNKIGEINLRCTNLPVVADILPEYSSEEIQKLKTENTPN
ncbi:hypothetical protein CIK05_00590 [Bdellovibrio sp. qaytius]|nr:hypothetical protein CIK05_00590 [Bdellovibrio sp. qaytius]